MYLTSNIINTLNDNKYIYGFCEALQARNIINVIHENKEDFIDYLQINLNEYIPLISSLLQGMCDTGYFGLTVPLFSVKQCH